MNTRRERALHAALLAALLLPTAACESLRSAVTRPDRESPPTAAESYLSGGPTTDPGRGAAANGERTLVEEFAALQAAHRALETRAQELTAENATLRLRAERLGGDLERERNLRAGADREVDRHTELLRDRDAKILTLSIANAQLERDTLRVRLATARDRLAALQSDALETDPMLAAPTIGAPAPTGTATPASPGR